MTKILGKTAIIALSSLTISTAPVLAAEENTIEEIIKKSELAINLSEPQKWADLMYSDNVIVVGEGTPAPIRDLDALMPTIEGITESVKSCSIHITDAKIAGSMAWTFANWKCDPTEGEPFSVRALYVWEKEQSDWKVTAEMYTLGEM